MSSGASTISPVARRWLLRDIEPFASARLFCFPYSGTGASMYGKWPRFIGSTELVPLQTPGRETRVRDPHYGTYQRLAVLACDDLGELFDRPYSILGHCGGALPGVELARVVKERAMRPPARLFVSSQVAPHEGPFGRFLGLSDDGLRNEIESFLLARGYSPESSMVDFGLQVLKQDIEANRKYTMNYAPQLDCPITVISWDRDNEVPGRFMYGWSACTGETRFVVLQGGHYDFLEAPAALIAELDHDLNTFT
jgi:surfactin synthase thioesterase subunit